MRTIITLVYGVTLLVSLGHGELIAEPVPSPGSNNSLPPISSELPPLVSFGNTVTLDALQHDFDVFSWQSFVALNWPANADGSPNNNRHIGAGGAGSSTVWQHYKESRDIFLAGGKKPPGWKITNAPPAVCTGAGQHRVLSQVGKTPNTLDESGEPFQTGPLIDQDGAYARFEILTNEVMFDYIVEHNLYSKSGQSEFPHAANFPFSSATTVGAIMLKAAWKVMSKNDDDSKFYTSVAYVYNNPNENQGVKASCSLQRVGLVGFHIGTKVKGNPQWIWSTFEQVDNVPTQNQPAEKKHYSFYKPNCGHCTAVNLPPPRPWNPATLHTQPSQIERVIPISPATKALNTQYQAALRKIAANSVWANYQLISTQWPTDANSATDPTGIPAPTYLANTTLESYIQGDIRQTSSSCIQCHNNATMTNGRFSDFTYLLQRAQ